MTERRVIPDGGETVIPLHEEIASVAKRPVTRGRVRIDVRVAEREQVLEQALERHDVEIEHVPVGRVVEAVPEIRQDGDVLVIPVVEEEVVLVRRLVLREEIHVHRRATRRTGQVAVRLRAEQAVITRHGVGEEVTNIPGDKHD